MTKKKIVSTKLSVITVCLNEPNIETTCQSIANQTFQDFEWIVIDGGSNSYILEILEKYKSRMDYFVSEIDGGIYHAMNKGIRKAQGTWLNFMNAGDSFAEEDALEKAMAALKDHPEVDVLYGEVIFQSSESEEVSVTPEHNLYEHLFFSTIRHQASFIKRSCFEHYGYYDEDLKIVSDYKFYVILHKNNVFFKRLNTVVATVNMNGISNTEFHSVERESVRHEIFTAEEFEQFHKKFERSRGKNLALLLRKKISSHEDCAS